MTRIVAVANATEAAKAAVRVTLFVELDFSSGFLRLHDGAGTLTWNAQTWYGAGQVGSIEVIQEDLQVIARPIRLQLSGVDASLVSTAMTEAYQGRAATLYFGFLNQDTNVLVADPEVLWEGRMDSMSIAIDQQTATIQLSCEPRLRREPRIARYTAEDQQLAYSGDTFFNLMQFIPGFVSQWGDQPSQYTTSGDARASFFRGFNARRFLR